jgi:hypothetical protein
VPRVEQPIQGGAIPPDIHPELRAEVREVAPDVLEAQRACMVVLETNHEPSVAAGTYYVGLSPLLDAAEHSRSLCESRVVRVHRCGV